MIRQILLAVACVSFTMLWAQDTTLKIVVQKVQPGQGRIRICLFDNEKDFLNRARQCIDVDATGETSVQTTFQQVENGTYAVVVYQDMNSNGKLDRNWMGLPAEPYGFSNNPSTLFGPPSFSKASFSLTKSTSIIILL
ncbi:MAG: DUF2141 domain-containing protein [Cyclobacteriaceae bacterium]|nr:DUF2141 domain-containing protein [Cyclobacteriaceae bacterium]UYN85412.1 MAG: DUF2141 domain-containing protein [Cyclobacteriaceae bacterium]